MASDRIGRSLEEEEEEVLSFDIIPAVPTQTFDYCLVGMFITYSNINLSSMKSVLADLWHPIGGVTIIDIGARRFLFRFYNQVDLDRVLDGAPWLFNKHLLVWSKIQKGEDPLRIPLTQSDVWVIIKGLKPGYMREEVAKSLGNFIGKFILNDTKYLTESAELEDFSMRIRVTIDVRQPLRRRKKLVDGSGEAFYAMFSYERVFVFCFLCGILGHTDSFCETRLHKKPEELKFEWDERLRAVPRRNRRAQSQWLCEIGKPTMLPGFTREMREANDSTHNPRQLMTQLFRNSLFGFNSNFEEEGDNLGFMETESMGKINIGDMEEDSGGPSINDENKKRPRNETLKQPSIISLQKDLIGGPQAGGHSSGSKTLADPGSRDSQKQ